MGFELFGFVVVVLSVYYYWHGGVMEDRERPGNKRYLWPLMSLGLWTVAVGWRGHGFLTAFVLQVLMLFAIGYYRATKNLKAEQEQFEKIERDSQAREDEFARRRQEYEQREQNR